MQEMDAKRSTKLPQRESAEENDRADTLSDACQEGEADGDVPAHLSKMTKSAEAPEATQEAPLGYDAPHLPPRGGNRPAEVPPPVRTDDGTVLLDATPTVAAASVPLRPANADDSAARSSTLLARNGYGLGGPSTPTEPATSSADLSVNATAAAQAADPFGTCGCF